MIDNFEVFIWRFFNLYFYNYIIIELLIYINMIEDLVLSSLIYEILILLFFYIIMKSDLLIYFIILILKYDIEDLNNIIFNIWLRISFDLRILFDNNLSRTYFIYMIMILRFVIMRFK